MNTFYLKLIKKNPTRFIVPAVVLVTFAGGGLYWLSMSQAATPVISLQAESGTISPNARIIADSAASGGSAVSFAPALSPNPTPPPPGSSVYVTAAQAASLPKSGNGYNNAKAIADMVKAGSVTPNLGDVNTRAGSVALTAATFWLANGKSDTALLNGLKTFILKAPGTNPAGGQALNPMRGLGGILAAVDILNKAGAWDMNAQAPNAGMTFGQYLNGLEKRNLGSANSRWQTIEGTSIDSANNWGAVARFSYIMIAELRNDPVLKTKAVDVMRRFLGDTTKGVPFNASSNYIASWDNSGSASGKVNVGIGLTDAARPGLDGVVINDVDRGNTGYSASAPYYGATGSGLSYQLEAAEYIWATAAVLRNMGHDVENWSNKGLIRMGDWFHRAKSGTTTVYMNEESAYALFKNARWYAGCFKRNAAAYGSPQPTSSGVSSLVRSQPFGDYMCGPGSTWPY